METTAFEGGSTVSVQTVPTVCNDTTMMPVTESREYSDLPVVENEITFIQSPVEETTQELALHEQLVDDIEKHKDLDGTMERLADGTLDSREQQSTSDPEQDMLMESIIMNEANTSDIPEDVKQDPEFQQKVGQIIQEDMVKGRSIDPESVQQRAYERFKHDQILDDVSYESRVEVLEKDVNSVISEQQRIQDQIARNEYDYFAQDVLIAKMGEIIMKLSGMLREDEARKKKGKKPSILELLVIVMSAMLVQFADTNKEQDRDQEDTSAAKSLSN